RVTPDALLQASNGAVADIVSRTPGAVGYVGIGYLSSRVKAIQVRTEDPDSSYVTPSYASVQSGKYPMARELFVFTNGSPAGAVLEFIDFMMSPEGQKLAEEEGFVPIMPIGQQ
ncbi:MAG: substrate-binding domain-containing protein, partial [Bacillota bacterium]